MTTVAQLRNKILECAASATLKEPTDIEMRLHSFVAQLSGSMDSLGEDKLDIALWALLENPYSPSRKTDKGPEAPCHS